MSTIYPWHQTTWDKFSLARSQNHLPHALLLTGDSGIGKLHLANAMVKSLLCLSPLNNEQDNIKKNEQNKQLPYQACNHCQACKTYDSGANPDYLKIELLEGKQQIVVDQIRQLSKFLNYTSSFNGNRVILLNPVERMNRNAANSLLKSLEEPSRNTIIVLITAELNQLIPTIKSRCQLLSVIKPNKNEALQWLNDIKPDQINHEIALEIANGKPLQAIEITEQDINNREMLATDIFELLEERESITVIAKKWESFDLSTIIDWQLRWIQNYIQNNCTLTKTHLKIKEKIDTPKQWQLYQQLINQKQLVHTSVNSLIFVENMLSSWLQKVK